MGRCTDKCIIRSDKRTKEDYCYDHGTLTFNRQAHDIVDESDLGTETKEKFKYSDKFIFNAVGSSYLTMDELADELGVSRKTLYNACSRYMIQAGYKVAT